MAGSPEISLDGLGMFEFYMPPVDMMNMATGMGFLSDGLEFSKDVKGTPTDPDVFAPGNDQWHLSGTWGTHADDVWADYTGQGVLVAAIDDGFQHTHHEIAANYRTDLDLDVLGSDNNAAPGQASDRHGTPVLGTIIADDNGSGGVGVAFDAEGFGIRMGFGAQGSMQQILDAFNHAYATDADVVNNSWGTDSPFADTTNIDFGGVDFIDVTNVWEDMAENGRGGLGQVIVFSAGNSRAAGDNANYHNLSNSQYEIAIAAMSEVGTHNSFSNPGANLMVAAGGSGVYTTDRTGGDGYSAGDYTNFSGTSSAAPIVSGVIALMLEASPDLGYRDVQEILAYSAQHNDSGDAGWQYNGATNWNGGGLHFSHDYGFGAADAFTVVRLAEHWHTQQTYANMTTIAPVSASPALAIPATGTVTTNINIAQDIEIEHVLINMDISHSKAGDLIVTLISPDGTESVLVDRVSNGSYVTDANGITGIDFEFSSNAHWGESSLGLWTLEIQDVAGGNSGTLNDWSLEFSGNTQSNDDVYIFTNDYGSFGGAELASRSTITDASGNDILNLTAVTSNTTIDLDVGTGTVAGKGLTIAGGTVLEEVYAGDGDDIITGNAADNTLYGGRGDDLLEGMDGDDEIDGEAGDDTATYGLGIANFVFNIIDAVTVEITDTLTALGTDLVRNVENFVFGGDSYTRAELDDYINNPPPDPSVAIDVTFTWSAVGTYAHASGDGESTFLTRSNMNYGSTGQQLVEINNAGGVMTIDYLDRGAPIEIVIEGGDGNDDVTLTGVNNMRMRSVEYYGGDGDDSFTLDIYSHHTEIYGGDGNDVLSGREKNDLIYGEAGNDTLNGGGYKDTLYGGTGNDILNGDDDRDTLYGEDGDDIINGGMGADFLYGGADNDTLDGGDGSDLLYGDAGDDHITTGAGYDFAYGGDGDDVIIGGNDGDELYGEAGNDTITAGSGVDYIYGGSGNDTIDSGDGRGLVYGGDGDDNITGGTDNDRLYGDADNDTIIGGGGRDMLYGGDGNDDITGGADSDKIYGDGGDDILSGGGGIDYIYGDTGNDNINGGDGNDYLYGDEGDDVINGGIGFDFLFGDDGNDTMDGGDTSDRLYGGDGMDDMMGGAGDDFLYGGNDGDTLSGGDGRDFLYGENGNDTLIGGAGDDLMYGGAGDDLFIAGEGYDNLYGSGGADEFGFTVMDAERDYVKDFNGNGGDRINITDLLIGYTPGDISNFLSIQVQGSTKHSFHIDQDGGGDNFQLAFTVLGNGMYGMSEQDLIDNGTLIVDETLL